MWALWKCRNRRLGDGIVISIVEAVALALRQAREFDQVRFECKPNQGVGKEDLALAIEANMVQICFGGAIFPNCGNTGLRVVSILAKGRGQNAC